MYETWLVIERSDDSLVTILKGLEKFGEVDTKARPRMALEQLGDIAVMSVSEQCDIFDRLLEESCIRAVSLAPHSQIRFFHNKVFRHLGGLYRVRTSPPPVSPFYRRFLDIEYLRPGLQGDMDTEGTELRTVSNPSGPALWVDPQRLELNAEQVNHLFGSGNEVQDLTTSFLLPPVRTPDHPDFENSYFLEPLRSLRQKLIGLTEAGECKDEPTALSTIRLLDEPALRDLLMDGASLRVVGDEGEPTALVLDVRKTKEVGAEYRRRIILQPGTLEKPAWASDLACCLKADLEQLVPGGLSVDEGDPESAVHWQVFKPRTYEPGANDGTWQRIDEVAARLAESAPEEAETLSQFILQPTVGRKHIGGPDNDLAEKLFILYAWRCGWTNVPEYAPWRLAMLDVIGHEFEGQFSIPEQRVAEWNKDADSSSQNPNEIRAPQMRTSFAWTPAHQSAPAVLRYSGIPEPDEILRWRLLLPLGTIVSARTLYLNAGARSRLNRGFVLA